MHRLTGVQMCFNGLLHAFDLISAETWQQLQAEKDRVPAVATAIHRVDPE